MRKYTVSKKAGGLPWKVQIATRLEGLTTMGGEKEQPSPGKDGTQEAELAALLGPSQDKNDSLRISPNEHKKGAVLRIFSH